MYIFAKLDFALFQPLKDYHPLDWLFVCYSKCWNLFPPLHLCFIIYSTAHLRVRGHQSLFDQDNV